MLKRIIFAGILILMVACDKNKEEEEVTIELNDISANTVEDVSATFDSEEQEYTDDVSSALDTKNSGLGKVLNKIGEDPRSYDTLSGYWTINRSKTYTFSDTLRATNRVRYRTVSYSLNGYLKSRFADDLGNSIQYPGRNFSVVDSIHLIRNITIDRTADVSVRLIKDGTELYFQREKSGSSSANHKALLVRHEGDSNWSLNINGDRTLNLEFTRNDTTFVINRSYTLNVNVVTETVKVLQRHFSKIVSGTIIRVISFAGGNTVKVETTFYAKGEDPNNIRYTRNFYKNSESSPFKTVIAYYN